MVTLMFMMFIMERPNSCELCPSFSYRTATKFKTLEPFWGAEYNLHVPSEFQDLAVFVYDYDMLG